VNNQTHTHTNKWTNRVEDKKKRECSIGTIISTYLLMMNSSKIEKLVWKCWNVWPECLFCLYWLEIVSVILSRTMRHRRTMSAMNSVVVVMMNMEFVLNSTNDYWLLLTTYLLDEDVDDYYCNHLMKRRETTVVWMDKYDLNWIRLVELEFVDNHHDYIQYILYIYQTLIINVRLLCLIDEERWRLQLQIYIHWSKRKKTLVLL